MTSDPDLVRELSDAVERQDLAEAAKRVHPDVVWRHNLGVGSPEEGVYHGRENLIALWERIFEPWEYLRGTPAKVRELGDGVVLVEGEMEAKLADLDTPIITPYQQRLVFQDGLLVRGDMVQGSDARLPEPD